MTDAGQVAECDCLVLIAGRDKYNGGKFVETGIAMGLKKIVIIIGHRENMLLWHPSIACFDEPVTAAQYLTNYPMKSA